MDYDFVESSNAVGYGVCMAGLQDWFAVPRKADKITLVLSTKPFRQSYKMKLINTGGDVELRIILQESIRYVAIYQDFADSIDYFISDNALNRDSIIHFGFEY